MVQGNKKWERQRMLQNKLLLQPLKTDEELAHDFGVSIQTVRLDRLALGIPDLRKRMRRATEEMLAANSALVGDVLDIQPGSFGISLLEITTDMLREESSKVREDLLFAQANNLAEAVAAVPFVTTGSARVRYKRPVFLSDRVVAKAVVKARREGRFLISVYSTVNSQMVFKGQFVVAVNEEKGAGSGCD